MHEALRPLDEVRKLRDPVLLAAFAGWNDNGGSATAALYYLLDQWDAKPLVEIDPEPFYDFTVQRPRVRLEDGERVVDWPRNRFHVATPPGSDRDFVLLAGTEPHLRWRSFTEAIADVMGQVGSTTSITLGAQPAGVPHTRPLPVTLSASHTDFEETFGLKAPASRYQGPTGIVGVINLHHRSLEWRNASLWAMSPHYLTLGPNPNVAISLVKTLDYGFHTATPLGLLMDQATEFEAQVRSALDQSPDAAGYVRQLEEQYDTNRPPQIEESRPTTKGELPATDEILDDIEQFFRESGGGADPQR